MKLTKRFLLVWLLLFITFVLQVPLSVQAETPEGIQVKPLRKYVALDPGNTDQGALTLKNATNEPQSIVMSAELFSVTGLEYNYVFRDNNEVSWIKFSQSNFVLQPNETKIVYYDLAVPADASPGGHYFSLLTIIDPKQSSGGVTEIRRVASLIYLEVGGDIIRKSQLTDFSLPWFSTSQTLPADVFLSNGGNSHVKARVSIEGNSWLKSLTRQPKQTYEVAEGTILPTTVRKLPKDIRLPNQPGFYQISAHYSPSEGGSYMKQKTVLYMPFWFMPILLLFICGVVFTCVRYGLSAKRQVHAKIRSRHKPTDSTN